MTITTVSRTFTTLCDFDNVRLKVPDTFQSDHWIPSTNIKLDGNTVHDAEHFYSGVIQAGGIFLNRHYYFPTSVVPLGKSIVARVRVEVEQFEDGRKFTLLRIYQYAERRRAEFELKIRQDGGEEGTPVEGTQTKIVFKKIEPVLAKALDIGAV